MSQYCIHLQHFNSRSILASAWAFPTWGSQQAYIPTKHIILTVSGYQPRQHIKKWRHYFVSKGPSFVFPAVMYECESWTIKKAECWRIDVFELWCWRRLLRVPWTARRSNQSILKEVSPGCSLEGLILKLRLQHFGHLMLRVDSLEDSDAGRDTGQEEKGTTEDEMVRWHCRLNGHWFG